MGYRRSKLPGLGPRLLLILGSLVLMGASLYCSEAASPTPATPEPTLEPTPTATFTPETETTPTPTSASAETPSILPSPTATEILSPTPTATPRLTPTATPSAGSAVTPTSAAPTTRTPTPTPAPADPTPGPTPEPTRQTNPPAGETAPTPTLRQPTPGPTPTPTPVPEATPTPTATPGPPPPPDPTPVPIPTATTTPTETPQQGSPTDPEPTPTRAPAEAVQILWQPAGMAGWPSRALAPEDTVAYDVVLDPNGNGDIIGAQFFIGFDPTVLEVSVARVATTLGNHALEIDADRGTVQFVAFTVDPLSADHEPFAFATISLKAIGIPGGGATTLSFEFASDGSKTAVADTLGADLVAGPNPVRLMVIPR